ncbi:MAG: hypothetical protein WDW36_009374 [Sanguina aurantia]
MVISDFNVSESSSSPSPRCLSTPSQDVVIIGGGPAGYVAAIKAGQLGLKAVCVEGRGALGGTCLNVGCIPSKALLNSSHMFYEAKTSFAHHGVIVGDLKYDWEAMQKQKTSAVGGLTKGIEGLLKKNKVEYVKGWGKLLSANEVEVTHLDGTTSTISTKNVLIATGSEVSPLPGVPVDEERIVTSTGALSLKSVPKKMVVIGAGYIGLEMGSVYSRLGSDVTVVEYLDTIGSSMDAEVRRAFHRVLEKQGLKFKMATKVTKGEVVGDKVQLTLEPAKGGASEVMEADVALVSIGGARALGDTAGMVKFVADAVTDKILGAHIMGPNAGEMIHECVVAMEYGASSEDIARTCHGHPTLSEAVKEAAMATYSKAIHS